MEWDFDIDIEKWLISDSVLFIYDIYDSIISLLGNVCTDFKHLAVFSYWFLGIYFIYLDLMKFRVSRFSTGKL